MNRKEILNIIFNRKKYSVEQKEILGKLYESLEELEVANSYFENATEAELIDYSIHKQNAARTKYQYYLALSKQLDIDVHLGVLLDINRIS